MAVLGDPGAQAGVLLAPVARVAAQFRHGQPVAGMPLDGAGQQAGTSLDGRAAVAGIQDYGLDVAGENDSAVDLCLDVVVEGVLLVGLGEGEQVHARGHSEVGRFGGAVGVAEGGAAERRPGQAEVRGAEPRGGAHDLAPEVQRAVDGPLVRGRVVVDLAEDPALPAPPVAAGMGGEPAVAGAGDELRVVGTVFGQHAQDRHTPHQPVRMEVEGDAYVGVESRPGGGGRDVP